MLTPEQRYRQAIVKARLQGARSLRRLLEGLEPFAECVMDLERAAIIQEIARANRLAYVMGEIARGRADNGRPLAAEVSRQMAREVLSAAGLRWPKLKTHEN